jgi:hypothetical protein
MISVASSARRGRGSGPARKSRITQELHAGYGAGLRQGNGGGLKWSYFPCPAVAPVAWLILADAGVNPFGL